MNDDDYREILEASVAKNRRKEWFNQDWSTQIFSPQNHAKLIDMDWASKTASTKRIPMKTKTTTQFCGFDVVESDFIHEHQETRLKIDLLSKGFEGKRYQADYLRKAYPEKTWLNIQLDLSSASQLRNALNAVQSRNRDLINFANNHPAWQTASQQYVNHSLRELQEAMREAGNATSVFSHTLDELREMGRKRNETLREQREAAAAAQREAERLAQIDLEGNPLFAAFG